MSDFAKNAEKTLYYHIKLVLMKKLIKLVKITAPHEGLWIHSTQNLHTRVASQAMMKVKLNLHVNRNLKVKRTVKV